MFTLFRHQQEALSKLKNGSVLVGGTGSGKTHVGISYFYEKIVGGSISPPTRPTRSVNLYVITTPKKRDDFDFQRVAASVGISTKKESSILGMTLVVDSWNNIHKYTNVVDSFFIFDEQRAIGSGKWSRSFIKISKKNQWIMMSATPADRWIDLVPVLIANGFYKNRTEFIRKHVMFSPYTKYPKILRYTDEVVLRRYRDQVYVVMPHKKHTTPHVVDIKVSYDVDSVYKVVKDEWNPYTNKPVKSLPEHNHIIRRIVNSDVSRVKAVLDILSSVDKLIIFYNFNYELNLLKEALTTNDIPYSEHNGHKHDPLPEGSRWVYLVQYMSGNEAWECFTTNHMLFYSMSYSYRITKQAMGRIDRLTTTYSDLYYYRLISNSSVDRGILMAFKEKKNFNDKAIRFI